MNIATRAEFVWSDRQNMYVPVRILSINWTGDVAWAKGASSSQQNLANQQSQFYSTMTNDYNQQFANQSAILGALNKSLNPIIQGGPSQFGYSTGETNALNSQAIQGTGQQYDNAAKSLREQQAAAGGGNAYLPSGVNQQQSTELATSGANQASNQLLDIQNQGYQQGNANYNNAVNALSGVASQYNPTGFSNSANSSGNSAFGSATTVQNMQNAASPWNVVGGLLGGAVNAGLSGFTGGFGTALGKKMGS